MRTRINDVSPPPPPPPPPACMRLLAHTQIAAQLLRMVIFGQKTPMVLHGMQIVKELRRALDLGYRHVYLTEGKLPDPWAALPSYWRQLVAAVGRCAPNGTAAADGPA